MAVYKTYDTVGIREDLADIIYSISPTETPFMSGIAKTKATNTTHEWQTDALADVASNAAVEGATISYRALATALDTRRRARATSRCSARGRARCAGEARARARRRRARRDGVDARRRARACSIDSTAAENRRRRRKMTR